MWDNGVSISKYKYEQDRSLWNSNHFTAHPVSSGLILGHYREGHQEESINGDHPKRSVKQNTQRYILHPGWPPTVLRDSLSQVIFVDENHQHPIWISHQGSLLNWKYCTQNATPHHTILMSCCLSLFSSMLAYLSMLFILQLSPIASSVGQLKNK